MSQANQSSTTRRAVLSAAPAVALAAVALPAAASPDRWTSFIREIELYHPRGPQVARLARDAGFDLADLQVIVFRSGHPASEYPALFFDAHNGGSHSVTPQGVTRCVGVF